jgi:hypothetical protein
MARTAQIRVKRPPAKPLMRFISRGDLEALAAPLRKSGYGDYLLSLAAV